jgi:pimeloyl-ACP methyl ester carboxylesterase
MSPILQFVLIIALLLSPFTAVHAAEAGHPAPTARPSTESILRQLGGKPCPNGSIFTCVTLSLPLDHFNPKDARTIRVTFAVLPAANRALRKGMFVTVTGGPGTSGIAAADPYTSMFAAGVTDSFDIVFFDQRGMALSGGLTCPVAAATFYQTDLRVDTPAREAALKQAARKFSQDCVSEMGNPASLPYLGTVQAVEDLESFRQVMHEGKFWLYGESYGTQYAQTYTAAHGEHLAGLMLDGAVDLTLSNFDFYAGESQAFNDTLVATLDACSQDPACAEDMNGDPLAAYDQLAALLDSHLLRFHFPLPRGDPASRSFTLAGLETSAAEQMYNESDRMMFNRALAAYASRQDAAPLARLLYINLGLDPQTLAVVPDPTWSDGIFYAVECQDYSFPGKTPREKADLYIQAGKEVVAAVPRLASYIFFGDLPCVYWPNAPTDLARPDPLRAEGVPTLVLDAKADPATPFSNGMSVYQNLENGYLITKEGGPHIIFGRGDACPDDLVTDFLVNDQVPAEREVQCPGEVADPYVPLAPSDAQVFEDPLDALASAENEISYLPEYYYWDGSEPTSVGCTFGGKLSFGPDGDKSIFTFKSCSFTDHFTLTGTGSYDSDKDRLSLDVTTGGRWNCDLKYVREDGQTKVTGRCDGKKVTWVEGD